MKKVSTQTLFHPERLRIVFFVTRLFFPMRTPFDVFKHVPAHHAIPGVVAIGPYAALYPSARMLQMGNKEQADGYEFHYYSNVIKLNAV